VDGGEACCESVKDDRYGSADRSFRSPDQRERNIVLQSIDHILMVDS
jgi:hypothetical protein